MYVFCSFHSIRDRLLGGTRSWDIDNIYIYTKTRYQLITKRVIHAYTFYFHILFLYLL